MKNTLKTLAALIAAMMMMSSAAALAEEVVVSEEIPAAEEIVEIVEAPAAEEAAPEIVEAPVAEEIVEIVEAPAAEEIVEIIEAPAAEEEIVRTANIRLACSADVDFGSTIKLVAELDGFEGAEYSLQWQINNGNGWQNIDGANDSSYSFELTENNMEATFRVVVDL